MARKGLFAALEDEVIDTPVDDSALTQSVMDANTSTDATETASTEIDEMNTAIEEAVDGSEEIEAISDVAQGSVDSGEGLSPEAAEIAEVAIESICNRLDMSYHKRTVPSLESFGQKQSRVSATKIAIEGFKEKVKEIWQGIKDFFKKVWLKIKDFFAKFFANPEKTKKAAQALMDKASERATWKPKDETIDIGSSAQILSVKKKVDNNSLGILGKNHVFVTVGLTKVTEAMKNAISILEANIRNKQDLEAETKFQDAMNEIVKVLANGINVQTSKKKDVTTMKIGPFAGDEYIEIGTTATDVSISFEPESRDKVDTKVKAFIPKQIEEACSVVIDISKSTMEYKTALPKLEALQKAFEGLTDSAVKMVEAISDDDNTKVNSLLGKTRKVIVQLNNTSSRLITMIPAFNMRLAKAVLNVANVSYNNLEEKK